MIISLLLFARLTIRKRLVINKIGILFDKVIYDCIDSIEKEIPIIVISAGKSVQSYSSVGSDIEVIDSETLEKSEHNFLGNIIDEVIPGGNFFQSGGHGTQSGIQLRGLPKRYSTVYIDGVKMSDPSNPDNSFYISNILIQNQEVVLSK